MVHSRVCQLYNIYTWLTKRKNPNREFRFINGLRKAVIRRIIKTQIKKDSYMVKKPVDPEEVADAASVSNQASVADYSWAVHSIKLNRSKLYVSQSFPELKGKDLENAVKERYIALHGLLVSDKPQRSQKNGGRIVNVAEDDGSKD